MLESDRIKNKALRAYYETGDARGIKGDWFRKVARILQALDTITSPEEL